ncbi:hypothetical protein T265_09649 [Opisthorchis viverrini]|uniref:Uncharacterized protein n=1 Tax=Opisthorchis viverrini TaxID=6198 RepID=A0A074Z533_OPIVI|nr:hypothetical protein T265_09649 [Opisthorchis viverrini]KER22196.1 hypothetical protein T265_09649 [Opisthorchis viverrini]
MCTNQVEEKASNSAPVKGVVTSGQASAKPVGLQYLDIDHHKHQLNIRAEISATICSVNCSDGQTPLCSVPCIPNDIWNDFCSCKGLARSITVYQLRCTCKRPVMKPNFFAQLYDATGCHEKLEMVETSAE